MTGRCTHGGDCTLHPTAQGLHDFTPTATDALSAVLRMALILGSVNAGQIQRLAESMGVELEAAAPPPEAAPYNLDPDREGKTWTGHGKPTAGIWWGFVVPDSWNRVGPEHLGSGCILACDRGAICVTFPNGQTFRFGISRTFRLGVI